MTNAHAPSTGDSMELKEYIAPLLKWWWLIVAATLVATISSYMATKQQPPVYRARTTLMVGRPIQDPNPSSNELYLTRQLAAAYADIAQREPIRNATMKALGLPWLPEYHVRAIPNTNLLEITVIDISPERAQAVASELANQLVRMSPTNSNGVIEEHREFINQQLTKIEAAIAETEAELTKRQDELAQAFSARQIADLEGQITALQNKLNTLRRTYADLLAQLPSGATNAISILEPASLPTRPIGPNKKATILMAAALGFVLAAGAAYLLEYLDDTLKNAEDVKKTLGLATLAMVPKMKHNASLEDQLPLLSNGQSAIAESYRVLRTNLQFMAVSQPLRSLLITSPLPTEGKSLTVANLGIALAQSGRRVILIDADLHRPQLHRLFGLRNNVGVTSMLLDDQPRLDDALRETAVPGLWVLTSGPLPPNPAELLDSERMQRLLEQLRDQADILLLDSPPVTALSDAIILATRVDGVLLVLDAGVTRRDAARKATESLSQVNARVIGALLNRVPPREIGYGYYYYSHDGTKRHDTE